MLDESKKEEKLLKLKSHDLKIMEIEEQKRKD